MYNQNTGSVINSQLEKQLGSGVDQLNLAQSINQIISALMSQLVSQVLHQGLGGTTQKPSGVTQSYIQQLSAEANGPSVYTQSAQNIQGTYGPYITTAQNTASIYNQIVGYFNYQNTLLFNSKHLCKILLQVVQHYPTMESLKQIRHLEP